MYIVRLLHGLEIVHVHVATHDVIHFCSIKIDSLSISESALTTSAGEGLTLQASGISIQVSADWSYEVDALM